MLTGRGCPFRCTFCYNSQGNIYRKRPLSDVLEELKYYIDRYQRRDRFLLVDDLLAVTPQQLEEFCRAIEPYQLKHLYIGIRMEGVTRESARWLKRAGCGRVDIGLESGCDKILKSMNKKINLAQAEEALTILKEEGIPAFSNIIFGDREEDAETVGESRAWREAHPEFNIDYDMIRLFPGTQLYKYAVDSGRLKDQKSYIENLCPAINISKLTDDEYLELKNWVANCGNRSDFQYADLLAPDLEPDFDTRTLSVSGQCGVCGASIDRHKMPFDVWSLKCGQCQKIIRLPLIKKGRPEIGEKNGLRLLQQYGALAFWGLGANFMQYVDNYFPASFLRRDGVYLMDKNPKSEGPLGLPVYNLDIIKKKELKAVIISVHPEIAAFKIIENLLADEYEIASFSLYDLQCRDLVIPRY